MEGVCGTCVSTVRQYTTGIQFERDIITKTHAVKRFLSSIHLKIDDGI